VDVAAKADDEVELQFLSQHLVEFMVTEPTVGDNADLDLRWQGIGQTDQALVFILVATVLESGCVDGQPQQRRGPPMPGQQ
jgi:hypothetical protein